MAEIENGKGSTPLKPTYENIKTLAKRHKLKVGDLLALDKTNDPFYFGTPVQRAKAEWFAAMWEEQGYTRGKHIRRIHYDLVGEEAEEGEGGDYLKHDGTPYLHDDDSRNYLQQAATAARHLGLLSPDLLEDMRLKQGVHPATSGTGSRRGEDDEGTEVGFERVDTFSDQPLAWTHPRAFLSVGEGSYELPAFVPVGYSYVDADQPYRLEAWFEKEVGTPALLPVCQRQHVALLVGAGNLSITQADLFLRRVKEDGRPTRILYFADFDVAGYGMPVAVARQVEYLLRTREEYAEMPEIALHRIALTLGQIAGENPRGKRLPRKPVVLKSDNPRMSEEEKKRHRQVRSRLENFEEKFGAGYTEVNALKEEELAQLLEESVKRYRDRRLRSKLISADMEAQEMLGEETEERIGHHREELDAFMEQAETKVSGYRALIDRLNDRMAREFGPIRERIEEVAQEIEDDLEGYGGDLELPERPEPETEGDEQEALYDSGREDYFEQLNHYRRYQRRGDLVLLEDDQDEDKRGERGETDV